jgi:ABC-type Fe3+-hydroxamate transport system substrate-binding protein
MKTQRIISLVPSDTYSLYRLGVLDQLVARTDYCLEPTGLIASIPSIGGTKNPRLEDIFALKPDLVIANQEENSKRDIERLQEAGISVYLSFPKTVNEGIEHLALLAERLALTHLSSVQTLLQSAQQMLQDAEAWRASHRPLRVFCPIWMDPLMTINGETFISDMLDLAGAQNIFLDRPRRYPLAADLGKAPELPPERTIGRDTRYPRVTLDEVIARSPELILLPDEPHPFSAEDAKLFRALEIPAAKHNAIVFCPGKDICWAGAQSIEGWYRLSALLSTFFYKRADASPDNPNW